MVFSLPFYFILGRYQELKNQKEIREKNEAKQAITQLV